MKRDRILVAVDGSIHSDRVVDVAIQYAQQFGSRLVLVHCHRRFPTVLGEPYREKEIAGIIREAEELVKPYQNRFAGEGIEVETRLLEGPAGAAISSAAEIEKCDLIIMGSRGLSNIASLIVGSVTTRVLQTASCSVLVVR